MLSRNKIIIIELFFLSPEGEEGAKRKVRGMVQRIPLYPVQPPHPALRATFSLEGRRKSIGML